MAFPTQLLSYNSQNLEPQAQKTKNLTQTSKLKSLLNMEPIPKSNSDPTPKTLESYNLTDFQIKVLKICQKIPAGRISTYGQISKIIGNSNSSRAIGNALNKNPIPGVTSTTVPCHRVIRSDGSVGGFASGSQKKIKLLKSENIEIIDGYIDLSKYLVDSKLLSDK